VHYAPWLDVPWVHSVRFEDAIADREKVAGEILQYGFKRTVQVWNYEIRFEPEPFAAAVQAMVQASLDTRRSATFRRGEAGTWREHFTPEIKDAFKAADKDNWLIRLGYENNTNW